MTERTSLEKTLATAYADTNGTLVYPREKEVDMFNEIAKLICGLSAKNIPFELRAQGALNGIQVKCTDWDAVCNDMSYGHELGLLEVMGSISADPDDVEGWLTADDILARL